MLKSKNSLTPLTSFSFPLGRFPFVSFLNFNCQLSATPIVTILEASRAEETIGAIFGTTASCSKFWLGAMYLLFTNKRSSAC
jgi:hypothetical protein